MIAYFFSTLSGVALVVVPALLISLALRIPSRRTRRRT